MTQTERQTSSADGVAWDLDDLYPGPDDPRIDADLDAALDRAQALRGGLPRQDRAPGPTAGLLLAALDRAGKPLRADGPARHVYAGLLHAARTDDPARGALLARTRERTTAINKHLIFFDLEWVKVADEAADAARRRARAGALPPLPRARSGPGGRTTSASPRKRSSTRRPSPAASAFVRLFDETTSALLCPFEARRDGRESLSLQQILAKLYDADRDVRRRGADGADRGRCKENAAAAHVRLQHPGPRPQVRLRAAPVRRPDGPAPPGQRDPRRGGRGADDRRRAAPRDGPALLPPQGPAARARPARRLRPLRPALRRPARAATGRRRGAIVEESYERVQPRGRGDRPRVLREALDRRRAPRRASAAGPSAAAPCRASTRTS